MHSTLCSVALITPMILSACDSRKPAAIQTSPSTENSKIKMKTLNGKIVIKNLPPNRGISAHVAFFPVDGENAPKPFDGDPPGEAIKDSEQVIEEVDFDNESTVTTREIPFSVTRPAGHYYIQLRFILYRFKAGKAFAQVERFFFGKRTLPLLNDIYGMALPVKWPANPLEELGSYGNIEPRNR